MEVHEHFALSSVIGTIIVPENIHSGDLDFADCAPLMKENLLNSPHPVTEVITP